eukprot:12861522-Alexandrium_andersonii.AAC.1
MLERCDHVVQPEAVALLRVAQSDLVRCWRLGFNLNIGAVSAPPLRRLLRGRPLALPVDLHRPPERRDQQLDRVIVAVKLLEDPGHDDLARVRPCR